MRLTSKSLIPCVLAKAPKRKPLDMSVGGSDSGSDQCFYGAQRQAMPHKGERNVSITALRTIANGMGLTLAHLLDGLE